MAGIAEEVEDDHEDEDVVDRERLLDDVAGEELQADLPRGRRGIEAGNGDQPRVARELP